MAKQKCDKRTINGVVLPDIWDDEDNIVGVVIETADGVEYIVERDETSDRLLALVDDLVEATGIVKERFGGDMTMRVESFQAIGPYDKKVVEDDDDDDDYYVDDY
jgi:hypothetical protein